MLQVILTSITILGKVDCDLAAEVGPAHEPLAGCTTLQLHNTQNCLRDLMWAQPHNGVNTGVDVGHCRKLSAQSMRAVCKQ